MINKMVVNDFPFTNSLSVVDYIKRADEKQSPFSIATEYFGNKITRNEYWGYIQKYRQYLLSLGVEKGEPVTISMMNSPEYEFVFMALLANGSIANTVSKTFLNADINRQTIRRKSSTLIISAEFASDLKEAFSQIENNNAFDKIKRIIFTTAGSFMPSEKETEYNSKDFVSIIKTLNLPKNIEVVYPGDMKKSVDKISATTLIDVNLLDYIATYSNTGGTTGAPKCACHSHRAIISLLQSHERDTYTDFNINENSRSLIVIPISHITSQFYSLLIRRAVGATLVYNPYTFNADILRDTLINNEIDDVVLPFGLYYGITRKELPKNSLKIKTPLCGGEPTPYRSTQAVNDIMQKAGGEKIIIGTGSTEFGSGIMATYGIENRCNESGCLFPYASAFILDPNTGKEINEIGKRGILYANAPWQMQGYLNDAEATSNFYHYKDSAGKLYGTNNDIVEIVGEHNGKPIYSMLGRASDFIFESKANTYYPGATITDGKVQPVDFESGNFLFDTRDTLLNIEGVMEVQPVIVPTSTETSNGALVANITINPNYACKDVLRKIYSHYYENKLPCVPAGVIFRTKFAKSLSTDKREVISLTEERNGYYFANEQGEIFDVEIPADSEIKLTKLNSADVEAIMPVEPPKPKKVFTTLESKI